MNYTPDQRRLIHKAFVEAKSRLSKDYESIDAPTRFICFAIANGVIWCDDIKHLPIEQQLAIKVIHSRIGGTYPVEIWLYENVPDYRKFNSSRLGYEETQNEMQAYRHRWLDALIEEFSN